MSNKYAGQQYELNAVHYLRAQITKDDTSGTAVSLGWLPPRAVVYDGGAVVSTAFNSATSDVLDIGFRNAVDGTTDDTDEYATDLDVSSVGFKQVDEVATAGDLLTDEGAEVVATWTGTGTAATTGSMEVFVAYIVDNDGDTTS